MILEYFKSLSNEVQAVIIWVLIWAIITKFSEVIQITNRKEKRASWPKYKLIPDYEYGSNHFVGISRGQETLELKVYTQDLVESGWRCVEINWYKNVQTDKIQLPDRKEKHLILKLKKFDPEKYFIFFIQIKYMCNGFYYTDYWRWRLVLKSHDYQIKFYPPVNYYWYIIQILKSYFKRRKLHPWED